MLDWVAAEVEDVQLKVIADFEFRLESMPVINVPWQKDTEGWNSHRVTLVLRP